MERRVGNMHVVLSCLFQGPLDRRGGMAVPSLQAINLI